MFLFLMLCVHVGAPKNLGDAIYMGHAPTIWSAWLTPENMQLPHMCYTPNFIALGKSIWT